MSTQMPLHTTGLHGPHRQPKKLPDTSAVPSSKSFLREASSRATLASKDTFFRLTAFLFFSCFLFLCCISFSYCAHFFSCCALRFWAARSRSSVGTLSSSCSSVRRSTWASIASAERGGVKDVPAGNNVPPQVLWIAAACCYNGILRSSWEGPIAVSTENMAETCNKEESVRNQVSSFHEDKELRLAHRQHLPSHKAAHLIALYLLGCPHWTIRLHS